MPKVWTEKALNEQRDINRQVLDLREGIKNPDPFSFLPTLVKAQEDIDPGGSGFCVFQKGVLSETGLSDADHAELCYNLVSEEGVKAGEFALATRVMLPSSGDAGWVILRIVKSGSAGSDTVYTDCQGCYRGRMPAVSLGVTGLIDIADPTYDGWADVVNTTAGNPHQLSKAPPLHSSCTPGLVFNVPSNGVRWGGNPLIADDEENSAQLFSIRFDAFADPLSRILFIEGPSAAVPFGQVGFKNMVFYIEQVAGGLMSRLTDEGGFERLDCTQTYSNYGLEVDWTNSNFASWLANGTFTLNP